MAPCLVLSLLMLAALIAVPSDARADPGTHFSFGTPGPQVKTSMTQGTLNGSQVMMWQVVVPIVDSNPDDTSGPDVQAWAEGGDGIPCDHPVADKECTFEGSETGVHSADAIHTNDSSINRVLSTSVLLWGYWVPGQPATRSLKLHLGLDLHNTPFSGNPCAVVGDAIGSTGSNTCLEDSDHARIVDTPSITLTIRNPPVVSGGPDIEASKPASGSTTVQVPIKVSHAAEDGQPVAVEYSVAGCKHDLGPDAIQVFPSKGDAVLPATTLDFVSGGTQQVAVKIFSGGSSLPCSFADGVTDTIEVDFTPSANAVLPNNLGFGRTRIRFPETSGPSASFTVASDGPGAFHFTSTSTDSGGATPLALDWTFGDGSTGSGSFVAHTYTKPGDFAVTLKATNTNGVSASTAHTVHVAAPTVGLSISFPGIGGSGVPIVNPGDSIAARLTVETSDGVGDLSNLVFTHDPLRITPAGRLTIKTGPSPPIAGPLKMGPAQRQSFDYQLTAVAVGAVTLTSDLAGRDASGRQVEAHHEFSLTVGSALSVAVSADPNPVELLPGTAGGGICAGHASGTLVPKPVTVTVTVTNSLDRAVHQVSVEHDLGIAVLGHLASVTPVVQNGDPVPGGDLGTLAPGASATATYPFCATNDGDARISALVSAANPDPAHPGDIVRSIGSTTLRVNPKQLLELDLTAPTGTIKAGDSFVVSGHIKNVSSVDSIELDPLSAALTGNAGGGYPVDVDSDTGLPNLDPNNPYAFPFPIHGTLDPDESKSFTATVQTVTNGGTQITIHYQPSGTVTLNDGRSRPLTDDDVLITLTQGSLLIKPFPDPLRLSVNDAPAPPGELDLTDLFANFTHGFWVDTLMWIPNFFASTAELINQAADFGITHQTVAVLQIADFLVTAWKDMTGDQREWWIQGVAHDMANFDKQRYADAFAAINQQVFNWFNGLQQAWDSGDGAQLGNTLGSASSEIVIQVALWRIAQSPKEPVAGAPPGVNPANPFGEEVVSLADRVQQSGVPKRISEGLKAIKAGDDLTGLTAAQTKLWGVSALQQQFLDLVAKTKQVLIAVRFRDPLAAELIESGKAVPKDGLFKIKGVDDLDIEYLGYRADDKTLSVLKKPITADELHVRLGSAPADLVPFIQKRWQLRVDEWFPTSAEHPNGKGLGDLYKKWADNGWVAPYFDNTANGVPLPSVGEARRFGLEPLAVPDGSEYFILKMAAKAGETAPLLDIAGDLDIVGIFNQDMSELTAAQKADIYLILQQGPTEMMHGDTINWEDLAGRDKLLADHFPGGEPLLVFGLDGQKAAFIDPHRTTFTAITGRTFTWLEGAIKTPVAPEYQPGQLGIPANLPADPPVPPYLPPPTWIPPRRPGGGSSSSALSDGPPRNGRTSPSLAVAAASAHGVAGAGVVGVTGGPFGACTWQFSTDPAAAVVRPTEEGFQQWSPNAGWTSLDLSACADRTASASAAGAAAIAVPSPLSSDRLLRLLPQTSLADEVPAGISTVTINGLHAVAPELDPAATPWFAPGESIVIDPGAPNEERAVVTSTSPLTLDRRLAFHHHPGEMVALASAANVAGSTISAPTPAPAATAGPDTSTGASQGTTGVLPFTGASLPLQLPLELIGIGGLLTALGRRRRRLRHQRLRRRSARLRRPRDQSRRPVSHCSGAISAKGLR